MRAALSHVTTPLVLVVQVCVCVCAPPSFSLSRFAPHVTMPLVCVVQHDRTMLRSIDVGEIAQHVLESDGVVGYALLPVSDTNYLEKERSRLGENGVKGAAADLSLHARPLPTAGRRLLPCLAWHDSTHIASVEYVHALVLQTRSSATLQHRKSAATTPLTPPFLSLKAHLCCCCVLGLCRYYKHLFATQMSTLGFIESAPGPRQAFGIALGLPAYLAKWRTYVYADDEGGAGLPAVGHLDGSSVRPSLAVLQAAHGESAGRTWRPAAKQ